MSPRNVYLVADPMRPIAEDLALSVGDVDSLGEILLAASDAQALQVIADHPFVTLAIVHTGPADIANSALGAALAERGALIVLIGDRAEDSAEQQGFPVLHRPYAPDDVLALLSRLLQTPEPLSEV